MKGVLVLVMHGAPAADFPRAELREFFTLSQQMAQMPEAQRAVIEPRCIELDHKMRQWPRTAQNDPFYAGACDLRAALEQASGCEVIMGFNEFCAPSLDEALDSAARLAEAQRAQALGTGQVVVITPMVTRGGEHSEKEIPEAVQSARRRHPEIDYRYAWPLELDAVAHFLSGQAARFLE